MFEMKVWFQNLFILFMSSGLFYYNCLNWSISNSRVTGYFLLLLRFIEIPVNANSVDPDHLIWVCTLYQLTFWGFPD